MAWAEDFWEQALYSLTAAGNEECLKRHVYYEESGGRCKKLSLTFYFTNRFQQLLCDFF